MSLDASSAPSRLPVSDARWRLSLDRDFRVPGQASRWQLLHRGPHSMIYQLPDNAGAAKFIMPRSLPRDAVRKYFNCQAKRELQGSRDLAAIGLQVPDTFGWGMTLSPAARYESVLFMQILPSFVSGLDFIRTETNIKRRQRFLQRLARQLARLHGNGYVHRDCHFANICLVDDDTLIWIDNDIRKPVRRAERAKGLSKALALLKSTARSDLSDREWKSFTQWVRNELADWPIGEHLINEVF